MANHKITIYHDGTILTMDADFPQVEALAVMDGRIVATGSLKDVKQAVGDDADLVSLEGGTLLPGFIDGHSHFCSGGMNRLYAADCAVENMEALKESLRRKLQDDRPSSGSSGTASTKRAWWSSVTPPARSWMKFPRTFPSFSAM